MNTGTRPGTDAGTKPEMNNELFALVSKALSDPNRLQIIRMITDQERCACKLLECFNISQPTLSHHMRILSDCDLIRTRKDGKWSHYSMNMETMEAYQRYVNLLYQAALASATDAGHTEAAGADETCESAVAC